MALPFDIASSWSSLGFVSDAGGWSSLGWFTPFEITSSKVERESFITEDLEDIKRVFDPIRINVDSLQRGTDIYEENGVRFFDNLKLINIPLSQSDKYTSTTAGEINRIENIAYRVYRNDNLWKIIVIANDIYDPFYIDSGIILRIPPLSRIYSEIIP